MSLGTGFQPAIWMDTIIRRQMLAHFPTVTKSAGFQPEPLLTRVRASRDTSLRLRLEAYTLSNRGRSLRIADSQSTGWKPVPTSRCIRKIPSPRLRLEDYTLSNRGRSPDNSPFGAANTPAPAGSCRLNLALSTLKIIHNENILVYFP